MITKLTEEQEKQIKVYQKKWYDKFHSLEFDEGKAKDFVDFLYKTINKEPPIKIILDSPMACQLAINYLNNKEKQETKTKYYSIDWWGDTSWYGYLCLYDYLYNVVFQNTKIPMFEEYIEKSTSISSLITFEGIAFISKPPIFINFDENNRLHCKHDSALVFADGWKLNYIHGVLFDDELFEKYKNNKLTSEEIISLKNAEQKALIIQDYGYEKIFDSLKEKKLIDKQTRLFNKNKDKMVNYELFEFKIDNNNAKMIKVEWFEKDRRRQTVLGVPNNMTDAIEAVAWTCYKTKEEWEEHLIAES